MERKWTKGPWRLGFRYQSITADGDTGQDDPESVAAYRGHLVAETVSPANAHLIAAAPDLYEALESVNQWFEGSDVDLAKVLKPVNDALRKARGEA